MELKIKDLLMSREGWTELEHSNFNLEAELDKLAGYPDFNFELPVGGLTGHTMQRITGMWNDGIKLPHQSCRFTFETLDIGSLILSLTQDETAIYSFALNRMAGRTAWSYMCRFNFPKKLDSRKHFFNYEPQSAHRAVDLYAHFIMRALLILEDKQIKKDALAVIRANRDEQLASMNNRQSTLKEGFVYVVTNPVWNNEIKIGSALDYEARLRQYNTCDPRRGFMMRFTAFTPTRKLTETAVLATLKKYQIGDGEWFSCNVQTASDIIERQCLKDKYCITH